MEPSETIQGLIVLLAALLVSIYMFQETIKGGVETASNHMRYLYNRASTNMGLSTFNDDELSDTEKSRNIKKFRNAHVGGLYNEGNTCFMNSVIQALASCMPITEFVNMYKDDLNFSGSLHDTIMHLNQIHTRRHGYSTMKLVSQIEGAQRWSRYNQEDAQEFFQELLNSLEMDKKNQDKSNTEKEKLTDSSDEKQLAQSEADSSEKDKKVWQRVTPFDGQFAVRVGCLQCGDMEGIRSGVLSSVDLSLEANTSHVTLYDLLKSYTAMETISGVECYRCSLLKLRGELQERIDSCKIAALAAALQQRVDEVDSVLKEKVIDDKVYGKLKFASFKVQTDKTKQTMFARPNPDTLMIHINRSVFDLRLGIIRKNSATVDFPAVLDLSKYTCDPENPINNDPRESMHGLPAGSQDLYDLKAAVVHYGSANFGHYICFRKFHGLWWRISDDQVDLTTEAQVLNTQGVFMLFYEKRGAAKSTEYPLEQIVGTNGNIITDGHAQHFGDSSLESASDGGDSDGASAEPNADSDSESDKDLSRADGNESPIRLTEPINVPVSKHPRQ